MDGTGHTLGWTPMKSLLCSSLGAPTPRKKAQEPHEMDSGRAWTRHLLRGPHTPASVLCCERRCPQQCRVTHTTAATAQSFLSCLRTRKWFAALQSLPDLSTPPKELPQCSRLGRQHPSCPQNPQRALEGWGLLMRKHWAGPVPLAALLIPGLGFLAPNLDFGCPLQHWRSPITPVARQAGNRLQQDK